MSNVDPPADDGPASQPGNRPPRTFGRPQPASSFAPPSGPPPTLSTARRRVQPSSVMIIALVVIMVGSLALIPLVSPAVERFLDDHQPAEPPARGPAPHPSPLDPGGPDEGSSGAGDPYFPNYGSSGFDALAYTIALDWSPEDEKLIGSSTIEARADHALASFYLDLVLPVTGVTVNGSRAEVTREGFYDIKITPAEPIKADSIFRATVEYTGYPALIKFGDQSPWQLQGQEAIVTGEPESAAWWYAANDHPSDPARFDVTIRVPDGWEAISVGRLVSDDTANEDDFDTWQWELDQTANTYQTFVAIGQYELRSGTANGRPYSYAVSEQLKGDARARAFRALETTPTVIEDLEQLAGPYPYDEIGGIVPPHRFWFAGLEAATRPVYAAEVITKDDPSSLLIHELAHMWYGDRVTLEQWNDIFINEAYASFAEWIVAERRGGRSAEDQLQRYYNRLQNESDFWQVPMHDPGREQMFETVYGRGPMTLQALRNVIGDDAFFELARQWADQSGPHSLEDWMDAAQAATSTNLEGFFQAWIYGRRAPTRTPANGLG